MQRLHGSTGRRSRSASAQCSNTSDYLQVHTRHLSNRRRSCSKRKPHFAVGARKTGATDDEYSEPSQVQRSMPQQLESQQAAQQLSEPNLSDPTQFCHPWPRPTQPLLLCYSTVFGSMSAQPYTAAYSMCGALAAWRCNIQHHCHKCWGQYFCGPCQRPHIESRRLCPNEQHDLMPVCLACDRHVSCAGMPAVSCIGGCGAYFCALQCGRRSDCTHEDTVVNGPIMDDACRLGQGCQCECCMSRMDPTTWCADCGQLPCGCPEATIRCVLKVA